MEWVIFTLIGLIVLISSLLYLRTGRICVWHCPKKMYLSDSEVSQKSHVVEYCKNCRRIEYIEE